MSQDTKDSGSKDTLPPMFQQFFQAGQVMAQGFASMLQQAQTPQIPQMPQMPQMPDLSGIVPPSMQYPKETADALKALQDELAANQAKLWQSVLKKSVGQTPDFVVTPEPGDRRFSAPEWESSPIFDYLRQNYLLHSKYVMEAVELLPVENERAKEKLRFSACQYVDSLSPSNYAATNPEAIRLAVETQGKSLVDGITNLIADVSKGRISMTDETAFEVGRNLATTEGQAVYENDLIQLIQYAPLTAKVATRPILIVPPCINKFYILDLQQENSWVRYVVEQGYTVFLISWKNPGKEQSQLGWDDYLEQGPITAVHIVQDITKQKEMNVLGFCVGGTLLSSALAVLAGRGEKPAASLTLLTTMLDFSDTGDISLFIDEQFITTKEASIGKGGLLGALELQNTFSMLRPKDLVWNYVTSNYLKGQTPPPFDILYWNADSTGLPGPFACWYIRNMYFNNYLRIPGKLEMCGVRVDLGKLDMPVFLLASREDHIVPWHTAYQSTRLLGGKKHFVLGASGHIAGVINPASKNKRCYWTNENLKVDAKEWLDTAEEHKGSWWTDWSEWVKPFAGAEKAAPKTLGNATYKPIEPAPGRYVKERVV
ncbi:MAG: class I poly(R)-hydroxyalkanoic acid synthase [Zoogloeaceae bacterium]|jgi:polyhydroxyalkanoate synthase|nr:class I poly(R)-hydroxyalkanoic acid synthase [Zoogloeaceae bacterium]